MARSNIFLRVLFFLVPLAAALRKHASQKSAASLSRGVLPSSGEVMLRSVRSGRRLHVSSEATSDGSPVVQHHSRSDGSRWMLEWLEDAGENRVMLKSKRSGKYLHVYSDGDGEQVYQADSTAEGSVWIVKNEDKDTFMLRSSLSGYYLHVKEDDAGSNDPLFQKSSTSEGSIWQMDCTGDKSDYQGSIDELLSEREGWGANTTGGKDGDVFVVTTTEDSKKNRLQDGCGCCLRTALESTSKYWIMFDQQIHNKTIKLEDRIEIKSDKTIAGKGSGVEIRAPPHRTNENCSAGTCLSIKNADNVIISDIKLDGNTDSWELDGECGDGIGIGNATYLWIHHNSFKHWPDVSIQMERVDLSRNRYMSITANRIEEIRQAFSLVSQEISFGRNFLKEVMDRAPKALAGKMHSYNNVNEGKFMTGTLQAANEGAMFLEQTVFRQDRENDEENEVFDLDGQGKMTAKGLHFKKGEFDWPPSKFNVEIDGDTTTGGGGVDDAFMSNSRRLSEVMECDQQDSTCVNNLYEGVKNDAGARM